MPRSTSWPRPLPRVRCPRGCRQVGRPRRPLRRRPRPLRRGPRQGSSALLLAGVASGVVPGFESSSAVAPALAAIDDRLTQLDARLRGLRTAASTTASDAVAAAQGLRTAVGTASDAAQNVRAQVEGLRVTIGNVQGGIERVLWIGAGGLLLIVGYVALLNALILWLGRRVPRPEAASITASTDPDPPRAARSDRAGRGLTARPRPRPCG